ncbi:MAG: hypothetical protein D6703_02710 [Zetaproteobacteria bacterium]|nr:MAG: hypothetical protein D6703_02710 [Zetaproteobacteria bacterium]
MSKQRPLSFKSLKTAPLRDKKVNHREQDFGAPYQAGGSLSDFLCSLPNLGIASQLFIVRDQIVQAYRSRRNIILACGGQLFDAGLSPLLTRLIELRLINGLAMTGAALLRDVEIALTGNTFTSSLSSIRNGTFIMPDETGQLINDAINLGASEGWGIGKSVGQRLIDAEWEHLEHSVVYTAVRLGTPVTVHTATGADSFHFHPSAHGESIGAAAMMDTRQLAGLMAESSNGVVLNIASNAVMPQVLLMALAAARNLGHAVEQLTTVLIDRDTLPHSALSGMKRLARPDGQAVHLQGAVEIMLPLLFASVLEALGDELK